jgi:hypothetical protein
MAPSSTPPSALVSLPYIHDVIDHISKLLAKKNTKTFLKTHKTVMHIFRNAKDKSDVMLSQGVYQIPCSYRKY